MGRRICPFRVLSFPAGQKPGNGTRVPQQGQAVSGMERENGKRRVGACQHAGSRGLFSFLLCSLRPCERVPPSFSRARLLRLHRDTASPSPGGWFLLGTEKKKGKFPHETLVGCLVRYRSLAGGAGCLPATRVPFCFCYAGCNRASTPHRPAGMDLAKSFLPWGDNSGPGYCFGCGPGPHRAKFGSAQAAGTRYTLVEGGGLQ